MDIDYLLTSTRAVRKGLDLNAPVDLSEIRECLRIGCQASNGSNEQAWKWLVIQDPAVRQEVGRLYRETYTQMTGINPDDNRFAAMEGAQGRLLQSVDWLVGHLSDVPVHVIPCYKGYMKGDQQDAFHLATYYGSIFPGVWNFQLALHSRGYGSCITTLHLNNEQAFRDLLGIPDDYMQGCLIPVGKLPPGKTFKPAPRRPIDEIVAVDRFDGPIRANASSAPAAAMSTAWSGAMANGVSPRASALQNGPRKKKSKPQSRIRSAQKH
jgi:nitroreductase